MLAPFKILQVSWLTSVPGNEDRRENILEHILQICRFLNDHGLALKPMPVTAQDITDDFVLASDDLTDEGLALMRTGYSKWLSKVDEGMSPSNTAILGKALAKIRKRNA